jgi:3-hydroxyisobutyrate dehydrogenase
VTAAGPAAVIGLGRMGGPIADHLVAAGIDVRVFDVDPAAVAARVGATASASPAQAAAGATHVSVVVFDDAQAIEVVDGEEGVLRTLAPGSVVSIHTTVGLDTVHALAEHGDRVGVWVLDAGISGGEPGAVAGTLLTMVGGPEEAVEVARPFLLAFSKEVLHAGPVGAGMALKLARNATGYAMMAAVHEAMVLARGSGVDVQMLRHTIAETGVLDQALAPFALGGPDPLPPVRDGAEADALRPILEHLRDLAEKDLDQALDLAARLGASTPVFDATRRGFHRVTRL